LDTRFDDTYTHVDTCAQDAELDLEEIQSPYKKITFHQDPVANNTCFMLDGTFDLVLVDTGVLDVSSTSDVRLIDRSIDSIDSSSVRSLH
jgi:hypothetical protein